MRFGLFCTYENPQDDYVSAYREQTELVRLAEELGLAEAWVAEHHFNPGAASPSCLSILCHLAAHTSRIRLGSAAVLLPFRDPITVAEDVATLDILSGGRFDFGVAKGGPFPVQNQHFKVSPQESRARMFEALALIEKLLYEKVVTFQGEFFSVEGIELAPKPVQAPIPVFMGTSTPDAIAKAAALGYGIMGAPPFPLAAVAENVAAYRRSGTVFEPRLTLIRFLHFAPTSAQAKEEARAWLQPFAERMRMTTQKMQPGWTPWFELDRMIDDSLIGTEAEVADKLDAIARDLSPRTILLKPLSPSFAKRKADLQTFAAKVRQPQPALA